MIGPVVGADDVCLAAENTLQTWLPLAIREEAAARNVDPLPVVADWEQLPDANALNTALLPAVVVASPGLVAVPDRHGSGLYTAGWGLVVSFAVRGESYRKTQSLVRRYAVVVRTTIMQHSDLGGIAEDTAWTDEAYAQFPPQTARTLGMGHVIFATVIPNVLDDSISPEDPDVDLNPDYPVQIEADITLQETH